MTKITIVGAGAVGATTAYALLLEHLAREIVIVDINKDKAEGEALDLENGIPFVEYGKVIGTTDYKLTRNSDIVVITAGLPQKPGETRLDLVEKNAKIMKGICGELKKYTPNSIFLFVSNPVDVLTYLGKKMLGVPEHKVFGSGTTLDTARLRHYTSSALNIHPINIHAYVFGEHGDHSFAAWSNASVATTPITQMLSKDKLTAIEDEVRDTAYKIIQKKGATFYAIGLAVAKICKAITGDKQRVMMLSTVPKEYGITGCCLSVPCIVGKEGIKKVIEVKLSASEIKKLKKAGEVLKEYSKKGMNAIKKRKN